MTAKEMMVAIGKVGMLRTEDFAIEVQVLDMRKVWSRVDYLVTPTHGQGEKWVSEDRVRFQ